MVDIGVTDNGQLYVWVSVPAASRHASVTSARDPQRRVLYVWSQTPGAHTPMAKCHNAVRHHRLVTYTWVVSLLAFEKQPDHSSVEYSTK